MERHKPDWVSGIFGVVLAGTGLALLIGNLNWADVDAKAFWAFAVIALGLVVVGSAVSRMVQQPSDPPGE